MEDCIMAKKVLIIGGTGFLGYYATQELFKRGDEVTILALPPLPAQGLFPPEVKDHSGRSEPTGG
jgi:nucleoside-diphosphate-sugar epimerase